MKISNNALNFLLAQYRAIFKRAYVKGIASAVLLTAGLAAGQAQAATTALADPTLLPDSGETITIDGVGAANDDTKYQGLQIASGSGSWDGEVVITSGGMDLTSGANNYITGNNPTTITGDGTLTINISDDTKYATEGLKIAGNSQTAGSGTVSIDIGAINVLAGSLVVADEGNAGSVSVKADTIQVGDGNSAETSAFLKLTTTKDQGVTLGRVASKDDVGSEISVLGGGMLTMQGSGTTSGASIVGNSLRIATGGVMLTDTGSVNKVLVDDFTVENGAFKVISGSDTVVETFQGKTASVESGGNFLVGTSGTWTIADGTDAAGKTIHPDVTFKNGSNVQVDGQIVVSGGLLTIESGAGLHATTAPNSNLSGSIVVAEKGTNQGLEIDSSVLKSFLTAKDTYHDITTNDSDAYITASGTSGDAAGSVVLKNGRLTFSDQSVELTDFFFASGDGTSGTAGTIVVSGSSSVIGGNDISIAKALKKDKDTATDITGLHVSPNGILTLGDDTATGLTQLSGSGVTQLTIRDGLNVNVANNGFFKVDLGSEKVQFTNSDTTWTSQVNGNLEFTAPRTFIKGQWNFNDDIKFSQVSGGQPAIIFGHDITQSSNYDTYVTLKGKIINGTSKGGYSGFVSSAAKNASTVVDLTQATLRSDADQAGMINIGASKGAVVKINGNQFSQILNSVKGNTTVEGAEGFALGASTTSGSAGVIEVTTPVTGEYDFSEFQQTC